MNATLLTYGDIRLLDVYADAPTAFDHGGADVVRVTMPATAENETAMQRAGYLLADRTLGVSVNLSRSQMDFDKLVRLDIVESDAYKDDILRIAKASFPDDRRFHILPKPEEAIAGAVLSQWVEALDMCLVCIHKEQPVGFLSLKQTAPDAQFVHLAAVEEKYRAAGTALSLYAKAAALCKARGYNKLEGRCSSRNTAVLNLYAYLGGSFASPLDIFLKDLRHDA